jgi:hypothetical protein
VGRWAYHRLRAWQQEGYADYVGKGGAFDFEGVRRDFVSGSRATDPAASGLYLRYHLLVAHLLDHRGFTPRRLLEAPLDPAPFEEALRNP